MNLKIMSRCFPTSIHTELGGMLEVLADHEKALLRSQNGPELGSRSLPLHRVTTLASTPRSASSLPSLAIASFFLYHSDRFWGWTCLVDDQGNRAVACCGSWPFADCSKG